MMVGGVSVTGIALLVSGWGALALFIGVVWASAAWRVSRVGKGGVSEIYPNETGAFRFAAARGDNESVRRQLKRWRMLGRDPIKLVNASAHGDSQGFTALHAAAITGSPDVVETLLKNGADLSLTKRDGWRDTALHYAASCGNTSVVGLLIRYGADIDAINSFGDTPEEAAEASGRTNVARLIQHVRLLRSKYKFRQGSNPIGDPAVFNPEHDLVGGSQSSTRPHHLSEEAAVYISDCIAKLAELAVHPPNDEEDCDVQHSKAEDDASSEIAPSFLSFAAALVALDNFPSSDESCRIQDLPTQAVQTCPPSRTTDLDVAGTTATSIQSRSTLAADVTDIEGPDCQSHLFRHESATDHIEIGWDGAGSDNVSILKGCWLFRLCGSLCEAAGTAYICWRPLRSLALNDVAFASIFWLFEFVLFVPSYLFVFCEMWNPIERKERLLTEMANLPEDIYPTVDVVITCCSEPVDIVEGTLCAALSLKYPQRKLKVYLCDDGARDEIRTMCQKVRKQARSLDIHSEIRYIARRKAQGIPHHAKAGNINHTLLKEGMSGDFVVVYDSDMMTKPNFLLRTLGHFLEPDERGWRVKPRAAFLQVPQDFYNVPFNDPLGHNSRFFYGPMMQGRDGIGSTTCVGTGVLFRRNALLSIGGQSYGSVTEDYKTCMTLQHAGFSTMYLNERLVYGLAPDDVSGTMRQRLRWAMGSLQIMVHDFPLMKPGLSLPQRIVFFQSQLQYLLAIPLSVMILTPILYLYLSLAPINIDNAAEFLVLFISYYWLNRLMIMVAGRNVEAIELWRGSQQYIYMVPCHLVAIWRVLSKELWPFRLLFASSEPLTFSVTMKKGRAKGAEEVEEVNNSWKHVVSQLSAAWIFILYLFLILGGAIYNIVRFSLGQLSLNDGAAQLVALAWGILSALYMWPPIAALLPTWKDDDVIKGGTVEWVSKTTGAKVRADLPLSRKTTASSVGMVHSYYGRNRTEILRRATLATVLNADWDILKRTRPKFIQSADDEGHDDSSDIEKKITPDAKVKAFVRRRSRSSISPSPSLRSENTTSHTPSSGAFGGAVKAVKVLESTQRDRSQPAEEEDLCELRNYRVVPEPQFRLASKPRFSMTMWMFYLINGALFAFFVGGGIAYLITIE